jgi:1,4-alpha-glucan branching enzyme
MTVAEESTAFPGVSRPVNWGGLGFGFKWNMGWMNDTLSYMQKDPIYRKYHHHQMTFGLVYAWSENYILPISHDEVVHGKGSMLSKMPGGGWEKFANLRAYYGFMWGASGQEALFMGQEFAQGAEWNHNQSLDWHQLEVDLNTCRHAGAGARPEPALPRDARAACERLPPRGLPVDRIERRRGLGLCLGPARGGPGDPMVVVVCNMTPVERSYRLGLPAGGHLGEVLNTDAAIYGGGNRGNLGGDHDRKDALARAAQSALVTLPPLSASICCRMNSKRGQTAAQGRDDMQPRPNRGCRRRRWPSSWPGGGAAG